MNDEGDGEREDGGTATDAQHFLDSEYRDAVIETKGALKMALQVVSNPVAPMTPEDEARAQGWKGLVELGRELAKGEGGNPLVRENADTLAHRYADKLMSTVSTAPDADSGEPPKSFRPQPMLEPETRTDPVRASAGIAPLELDAGTDVESGEDEEEDDDEAAKDRRFVPRKASKLPRFSKVAKSYFKSWEEMTGKDNKDIRTARGRADLFTELIGDHPVDTYTGADLKAYVRLLKYWPGNNNERPRDMSAREIIEDNSELRLKPLSMNSLKKNYIGIVRTIMSAGAVDLDIRNPFEKVRLHYPNTARPAKPSQPLSAAGISSIFRTGVESGLLDEAVLPLLGHLTGRRLGLLIHLKGNDIREKYPGVWVAETDGIVKVDGAWTRVPFKTDTSTGFFLLHDFLKEIGFVDWATAQGDRFLFPQIMKLENPSKSASSYMQRLYRRAGIKPGTREVFHSLRAGNIDDMRDAKVDPRDRRLQAGHTVGDDEHDNYGFKSISEIRAREMVRLPLNPDIDFSVYEGLDFEKMAGKTRTKGKRRG